MAGSVTIINAATPKLIALREGLSPARINPRIATAVARVIFDHLAAKESSGNKNGWPSQHFYARAAKSITASSDAVAAYVSINIQGFRQRLEGGTIKPVEKKMLAIPARAEASGRRPEEFGNLKVIFGKRSDGSVGPVALVAGAGGATKRVFHNREANGGERPVAGADEGVVMYWLVLEAHQNADPSVMPSRAQILAAVEDTVSSYAAYLKRRQN